ncbi:MAG: Gfo/Idh/MocA family oxidoreductase [Clostridia bacterium]|nr:Gfo/Idh/MocA family oxidoreductase [Clostridia bacterium]
MYKIAILGCENSHANAFLDFIEEGLYPEIEVIGIYSDEETAVKGLNEKYHVPIMPHYDTLVGKVDGIMITARHGDRHLEYATPYFSTGIPMFIDKPITISEQDALTLMRQAKKNHVRLCGGSTCAHVAETKELKQYRLEQLDKIAGGQVLCPIQFHSIYGGFFFYAQHLVQVVMEIFGENPCSVIAQKVENKASLILKYPTFIVNATYVEGLRFYHADVFTNSEIISRNLSITADSFHHEMDAMMKLLQGEEMEYSYDSFIKPVFIMNAIHTSLAQGKKIEICYPQEKPKSGGKP